jgi:predicted flap endonuclease-1-like 5' DNA nuclease
MANYAIERALEQKEGQDNCSWGSYLRGAACSGVLPTNAFSASVKETAPKAAKSTAKTTTASKADDLTIIEGIGPKIADLLVNEGIDSFAKLAKAKAAKIKEILTAAGSRYKMHDPTTWAKQAQLAADGKMEELEKLKVELNGGKVK